MIDRFLMEKVSTIYAKITHYVEDGGDLSYFLVTVLSATEPNILNCRSQLQTDKHCYCLIRMWKSAYLKEVGQFWLKFHVEGTSTTNHLCTVR